MAAITTPILCAFDKLLTRAMADRSRRASQESGVELRQITPGLADRYIGSAPTKSQALAARRCAASSTPSLRGARSRSIPSLPASADPKNQILSRSMPKILNRKKLERSACERDGIFEQLTESPD